MFETPSPIIEPDGAEASRGEVGPPDHLLRPEPVDFILDGPMATVVSHRNAAPAHRAGPSMRKSGVLPDEADDRRVDAPFGAPGSGSIAEHSPGPVGSNGVLLFTAELHHTVRGGTSECKTVQGPAT